MSQITEKIVSLQLPSLIKKHNIRRQTVNYADARRIGILVTLNDHEKQHTVDEFVEELSNDDKDIEILCYDRRRAGNKLFGYVQFNDKDISLLGKIKNEYIIDFINTDFDYLMHLDMESTRVLDKILVLSRAKCRVGADLPEHRDFYELMVKAESLFDLCEMMLHYTKMVSVGRKKAS